MQIIFICSALLLAHLLGPQPVQSKDQLPVLKHLEIGNKHYVEVGKNNFGFQAEENGVFKTVAVNKGKVTVWLPDCTTIIRTWPELNRVDRKAVKKARKTVAKAYKNFAELVAPSANETATLEVYKSTNEANEKQSSVATNDHGARLYQQAHSDLINYSDREVSIPGEKLDQPELYRVFIFKKSIAYVYSDRFVIMKPRWCLFEDDKELLSKKLRMKY